MVGWCEKQNEEDILMDNSKKTMSSGKVFEMIMCALRCKSKVDAKHWIMWNGSFVKESFSRHNVSKKSFFDQYTIRVLSSMLSTALDMNFGENFIKGETRGWYNDTSRFTDAAV